MFQDILCQRASQGFCERPEAHWGRYAEEGPTGLEDKPRGRPKGVSKIDLRTINETRKIQQNLELGEYRVSAALEQIGIHLGPRSVGRILAINREMYGLKKPKKGAKEPNEEGR